MLGIDTSRPTVFLVNRYGRPDFRFHTYAPFHHVPGTSFPVGFTDQGQMSAWGGSTADDPQLPIGRTARLWFYDVSAGPDWVADNWELSRPNHYGNPTVPEHRIPPIWEYGTSHRYRPFDDLSADLAKVVRDVAVNGLFGATPDNDPALSPPLLQDDMGVDVNLLHDPDNQVPGDALATRPDPAQVAAPLTSLDPSRTWSATVDVGPSVIPMEDAFMCSTSYLLGAAACPSLPIGPPTGSELPTALDDRRERMLANRRGLVPVALFDVPEHRRHPFPIEGFTWPQPATRIQWWAMAFDTPVLRMAGYTADLTAVSATGSYLGLLDAGASVDTEQGAVRWAADDFAYVALTSTTPSAMSWLPVTIGFSQFERDAMARWMTAVRLQWSNHLLDAIYDSGRAGRVRDLLLAADGHAADAVARLGRWDLAGAAIEARDAYKLIVQARDELHMPVEPWSARQDQGHRGFEAWEADPTEPEPRHVAAVATLRAVGADARALLTPAAARPDRLRRTVPPNAPIAGLLPRPRGARAR
jgi:hypothetical protein